ncbi:MAG: hypothetical protein DMF63_06800 [Acidobacteria bacterium]|nr:MAG: hypothetical protein DMF63_06800 [Acidobacteriota bacterium]
MKQIQTVLFIAYLCLMLIILGGTIFSVLVEYPNWFANIPVSLEATRSFYKVLHPGYFFQIFGPLTVLSGIGFVIVGWRISAARKLVAVSVVLFVAIELLTFFYIYPRLNILFVNDLGTQSIDALKLTAKQFTIADNIRTVLCLAANAFAIAALFKFFKHRYATVSS